MTPLDQAESDTSRHGFDWRLTESMAPNPLCEARRSVTPSRVDHTRSRLTKQNSK